MSIELSLLKLFCGSRKTEVSYCGYLETLNNLERELKLLFNLVHRYYKEFDEDSISHNELLAYYELKYPKAKERDMHLDLMTEAFASDVTEELVMSHIDQLIERHQSTRIINKLLPVMEGDKYGILSTVGADVDQFVDLLHNPPDSLAVPLPCELSVEELIEKEIDYGGIPWHLKDLTNIIGGIRKQTLGLIYAYVGTGKTSFALSAAAAFAEYLKDTEDTIVYCGNEESDQRLKLRLLQATINWTQEQIGKNGAGADSLSRKKGIDRVKVFGGITTGEQLEYIVKEYSPHVVFVDQAPYIEITTKRKQEGVAYLETLFQYYRKLGAVHDCAVVGVAQAEGKAEDSKYLKLGEIYGARVAIQGALDWACGIGKKDNDPVDSDLRYVNISKNKGLEDRFVCHFQKYQCHWEVN